LGSTGCTVAVICTASTAPAKTQTGCDSVRLTSGCSVPSAAPQAGLLRVLGVGAMAILGPLYLVAPAVAGQVPELLNPAYRALLWSWTPFRFSAEGLRSFLQGTPDAPDAWLPESGSLPRCWSPG
jgi:hypothetical protein